MPTFGNLIHESSTGTGTGNLTIAAINGRQRISELLTRKGLAFGDNGGLNPLVFIQNRDAAEWEICQAYLTDANTLVRKTPLESSNGDATVNFSAGTKDISVDVDADTQSAAFDYGLITGAVTVSDDYGSVA